MKVDFDNKTPIYIQIIELIKRRIVIGELREGDKLPSVRKMSTQLKVNPNTIQRAYQELEREELTFTQRGMGTFVTKDKDNVIRLKKEMAKQVINNFINGMKELGFDTDEILSIISRQLEKEE